MNNRTWTAFNVVVDGGGMIALSPNGFESSVQLDSIEYKGIDLPVIGPDDHTPDREVIFGLLRAIKGVELRPDFMSGVRITPDYFRKWVYKVIEDFSKVPEEEFFKNEHLAELTHEILPTAIRISITPVKMVYSDGKWVPEE